MEKTTDGGVIEDRSSCTERFVKESQIKELPIPSKELEQNTKNNCESLGAFPNLNDHSLVDKTVAQTVVEMLEKLGVKYAFGVSGGAIASVWAALENSSIEVLHFRHEAGAAFAATEASLATNSPIVVFATAGPGFTNALTGLFAARGEGAKIIFISPSTSPSQRGRNACQETSSYRMPLEGLFTSGTLFHYAVSLQFVEEIPQVACQLTKGISQMGGFVAHINIPTAVQTSTNKVSLPTDPEIFVQPPIAPTQKTIKKCVELLTQGEFAIWVGYGARDAAKEIRELAEKTGAAVFCSPRGKGIFPESDSQFVGVTGLGGHQSVLNYMQEFCPEHLLVLGTRLGEFTSFWNPTMVPKGGFIQVDINPQVMGVAYPNAKTLAVQSDAKIFLKKILEQLKKQLPKSSHQHPKKIRHRPEQKGIQANQNSPIRPQALMAAIQQVIVEGSDALVMAEPGNSFAWATNMLRFDVPNRYRTSTDFASMGHTVTGVVGATLVRQSKAVAIVGDGAMLMNCEISTAVKYQIPAVWIVLNDACYNMVDQVLPHIKCKNLVQIPPADFVQIARGMGADGIRVSNESEIFEALEKALASPIPFVIDVLIDPEEKSPTETRMMSLKNQSLHN
ncbi:MAG: thiamine pyrophosphate-dependent enzyme (plasmid) [Phormidium sp.]